MENKIAQWRAEHSSLLEAINICFALFDEDYTCLDVNNTFLELVGGTRKDFEGVNLSCFYSDEEFETLYNLVEPLEIKLKQRQPDEKKHYDLEWFMYHLQTGEKIPLLITGSIAMDSVGDHEYTYVTVTDLREQKHIQEELKHEKSKLEAILFGIGDCVTVFDAKGKLLISNPKGKDIRKSRTGSFLPLQKQIKKSIDLEISGCTKTFEGKVEVVRDTTGNHIAYVEILKDISKDIELERQTQELHRIRKQIKRDELHSEIIGGSRSMRNIFDLVLKCSKVESTVLVTGETGVGKELIARAINNQSHRNKGPFIAVNCAAFPETLLESELFGHRKGAFTGAVANQKGLFREADGGTLFLDEIGDLSSSMQAKLLRVIQEKVVRPVGGGETYTVDIRIIAATHRNLKEMAERGEYRSDLYYRLAVINIEIPPLRERKEDILPLAEHFLKKYNPDRRKQPKKLDHLSQRAILQYDWPGNVRELQNCIEHSLAMSRSDTIFKSDLPVQVVQNEIPPLINMQDNNQLLRPNKGRVSANSYHSELKPWQAEEKAKIETALIKHKGNRGKTAEFLGVCRATLWRKINLFGIDL